MNFWFTIIFYLIISILVGLLIGFIIFKLKAKMEKKTAVKKLLTQKEKFIIGGEINNLEELGKK